MSVHIYNLRNARIAVKPTIAAARLWCGNHPREFFSLWDDGNGERWERKGGQWRQTEPPQAAEPAQPAEQWWQRL
jgi:hypothetical protein